MPTPQEVEEFVNDAAPAPTKAGGSVAGLAALWRTARAALARPGPLRRLNGCTIDGLRRFGRSAFWVIGAFNRDLPFDQFTVEQLAGDMLPQPTREQLVATGFQRNTSFNEEGGTSPEQFRVERTVDRTNTTGAVWLGLTVGCAQCHNHKYDPVSQKEYYQLYAYFNSIDEPKLSLPAPEEDQRLRDLKTDLERAKKQPPGPKKTQEELKTLLADFDKETNGGWRVIYPKWSLPERVQCSALWKPFGSG